MCRKYLLYDYRLLDFKFYEGDKVGWGEGPCDRAGTGRRDVGVGRGVRLGDAQGRRDCVHRDLIFVLTIMYKLIYQQGFEC